MYSINQISSKFYENKSEFVATSDPLKLSQIHESSHRLFEICQRQVSFLEQRHPEETTTLNTLRGLQWKCYKLETSAAKKIELIQKREKLFHHHELPESPKLTHLLADIASKHPELTDSLIHFERTLGSVMRTRVSSIEPSDVSRLIEFLNIIERDPFLNGSELHDSVRELIKVIKSSFFIKTLLISDLKNRLPSLETFSGWNDQDRILLFVQLQQILSNPFEPKFSAQHLLSDEPLLLSIVEQYNQPIKQKDYWDWAPPLEKAAAKLANTPDLKQALMNARMDGLQRIMHPSNEQESPQHLIVGAGPAGLIHALCLQMHGKNFHIIEKRGVEKNPRLNTVTLGKWEPKELEILFFFGAIQRMEHLISFGHNRPFYNEIRLGDLEQAFTDILKELRGGHNPIQYGTTVISIDRNQNHEASCQLLNSQTGEMSQISPFIIIAADGFQGRTKELVGVEQIQLATRTLVHFSIFNDPQAFSDSCLKRLCYKINAIAKSTFLIIKMIAFFIWHRKSFEETYAMVIDGGPTGLSRLPMQDYLLRVLNRKEHAFMRRNFQDRLEDLQLKISAHRDDQEKLNIFQQEHDELLQQRNSYLTKCATDKHGMFDFLHSLFNPQGHQMKPLPMLHQNNFLVDVNISQSERSSVCIGKSLFLIRGDACHTTDPYSGTGCKTALEETIADSYLLQLSGPPNRLTLAALNQGIEHYRQKTINGAFKERFMYYKGTENASRFIEMAKLGNIINDTQGQIYLRASTKRRYGTPISIEDRRKIQKMTPHLIRRLRAELKRPRFKPRNDRWHVKESTLTKEEQKQFNIICRSLIGRQCLPINTINQIDQFHLIAAKLAANGNQCGSLLYLIALCYRIHKDVHFYERLNC